MFCSCEQDAGLRREHCKAPLCTSTLLLIVYVPCSKIAEAEAAVSVNEKKWLVMHMHVQLKLDELRGPPALGSL
jgi:hypothetical protein